MSTTTTYYNMTLPAQEDYYDVDIFNENYEIIDEAMKELDESKAEADHVHLYAGSSTAGGKANSAVSADSLSEYRAIRLTGGATGSYDDFDGTNDAEIEVTEIDPDYLGKPVPVAKGGTGATTVAAARNNLGLADVATSGSYNDLSNLPFVVVSNIEELIAALEEVDDDGGTIYLLPGTYTSSSDLAINIKKNNVTLQGAGQGVILNAEMFIHIYGKSCTLRDMTITRNISYGTPLIVLSTIEDKVADNFLMDNVYINCLGSSAASGFISFAENVKFPRLSNCVIETDRYNDLVVLTNDVTNGIVIGCTSNFVVSVPNSFTVAGCVNIINGGD